ncbi:alpha-hydroxy-acid oxidizing protein [Sodalis sp.]|uniref:alpha-hydroxy-acid oxidizing protein n=1 Tax=Sodalis sp. (in: enterobacteria) TaxID=1898979 RepID=UPI0038733C9D
MEKTARSRAIALSPARGRNIEHITTRTTTFCDMKQPVSLPLILVSIGLISMLHPEGELLAARATETGVPYSPSTVSISSIKAVAAEYAKPFGFDLHDERSRLYCLI